jgi:hypothetical protein
MGQLVGHGLAELTPAGEAGPGRILEEDLGGEGHEPRVLHRPEQGRRRHQIELGQRQRPPEVGLEGGHRAGREAGRGRGLGGAADWRRDPGRHRGLPDRADVDQLERADRERDQVARQRGGRREPDHLAPVDELGAHRGGVAQDDQPGRRGDLDQPRRLPARLVEARRRAAGVVGLELGEQVGPALDLLAEHPDRVVVGDLAAVGQRHGGRPGRQRGRHHHADPLVGGVVDDRGRLGRATRDDRRRRDRQRRGVEPDHPGRRRDRQLDLDLAGEVIGGRVDGERQAVRGRRDPSRQAPARRRRRRWQGIGHRGAGRGRARRRRGLGGGRARTTARDRGERQREGERERSSRATAHGASLPRRLAGRYSAGVTIARSCSAAT